jgi:hypothetical protein
MPKEHEKELSDLGGLQVALQELLGVPVDLLTPGDLPRRSREQVLRDAIPVRARIGDIDILTPQNLLGLEQLIHGINPSITFLSYR